VFTLDAQQADVTHGWIGFLITTYRLDTTVAAHLTAGCGANTARGSRCDGGLLDAACRGMIPNDGWVV